MLRPSTWYGRISNLAVKKMISAIITVLNSSDQRELRESTLTSGGA